MEGIMKKRLLIMTLIIALVLNQFSLSAAVSNDDDENLEYAQKLKKLGVFVGSDKGFELDRPGTRLEGIIMLIRLLGLEEEAQETYYDIPFTDVPDWAMGYVSYAYNYGLSNGISDTQFGSQDILTNMQYFTFMARALDYDDANGEFKWDESISFMNEIGFVTDAEQTEYEDKLLLRSDIAKLSYKLMTQPVRGSMVLLVDQLLQEGVLDPSITAEIGIYTPIQTDRLASAIVNENEMTARYDTLNIDRSVEEGYPSPYAVPATITASSSPTDIITFTQGLSGQALFDSLDHKGFEGLTATYELKDITWFDFIDSIRISNTDSALTVKLKDAMIYENEIVDQYEQYFNYHNPVTQESYGVHEVYFGDYSEPIENLSLQTYGTMTYMFPFKENDIETYNPLILTSSEKLLYITFTGLEDETVLYLEKQQDNSFIQQWISLKDGLVVKENSFDSDGVAKSIKVKDDFVYETIDDSIFVQPDIEYKDLTFLVYALTYDNFENIQKALINTFSSDPFSFDLVANGQVEYTGHVNGYDGGDDFGNWGYISYPNDSLGNEIELRQFYDGSLFHTIAPVFETDEVYEGSVSRLMMFDFDELAFRDFNQNSNIETFTFEDTSYSGVRGGRQLYDYTVNTTTNMLESITSYAKDDLGGSYRYAESIYTFENFGPYDASLFEVPSTYSVLPGQGPYYDGEHVLHWFYANEFPN